jgi:trimeric autotransporter adhesin
MKRVSWSGKVSFLLRTAAEEYLLTAAARQKTKEGRETLCDCDPASAFMSATRNAMLLAITFLVTYSAFGGKADSNAANKDSSGPPIQMHANSRIPWGAIGAAAGDKGHGNGLAVSATNDGATLRCAFQKMEGHATPAGLWLTSTTTNSHGDHFRLAATTIGRDKQPPIVLSTTGLVRVGDSLVRWERPGLTEEYSVNLDGVRQDFVIAQPPAGEGALRVELALSGARADAADYGAKLTLDGSRRELAYSRLHAVDANGKELSAEIKVISGTRLALSVDDHKAAYPVRIDPTFSDANWISLGGLPGVDSTVSAIVVNTNAGLVYIGGSFNAVGTVIASNVAVWNGSAWSALGCGVSGTLVTALALDSYGDLYVGGIFTNAGCLEATNIAVWDGSEWWPLGTMTVGDAFALDGVTALAVDHEDNLFVAGDFSAIGGVPANYIAEGDGLGDWWAIGSGFSLDEADDVPVRAFAVDKFNNLWVAGAFSGVDGYGAEGLAVWNGTNWAGWGIGNTRPLPLLSAVAVDGAGHIYVGGIFEMDGPGAATNLAEWTGTGWSVIGPSNQFPYAVDSLILDGAGNLYVGGTLAIAKWNGSVWSSLGSGIASGNSGAYPAASALALDGSGNLYAGGYFSMAGGVAAANLAKWNGNDWSALGSGIGGGNTMVLALAVSKKAGLYVAGNFTQVGSIPANSIAQWDGSGWSALASGIDHEVCSLALDDAGNLYAGGSFTNAGGIAVTNIAKWDGTNWSALGAGLGSANEQSLIVRSLVVDASGILYAGGQFITAGGVMATNIARWDGSSWSALSWGLSPINGYVAALAIDGTGNLFAGGAFTNAGGTAATNIAQWNGSAWSGLGAGWGSTGSAVYAVAVDRAGKLYAGGAYNSAVGFLGTWNGTEWSGLASSTVYLSGLVNALAPDDMGNLYVGGQFTTGGALGRITFQSIGEWNGSNWLGLGSGVSGGNLSGPSVTALALNGAGRLYAGGDFAIAGSGVSAYVAQANVFSLLSEAFLNTNGNVAFNLLTTPNTSSRVLAATNLTPPIDWQPIYTNVAPANGAWQFTDTNASHYPARYYRSSTP